MLAIVRPAKKQAKDLDPRGRLSRDEANLMRSALVFTSSGIDACCKRLLRDALPALITTDKTAARKFDEFIIEQLANPSKDFHEAILAADPRPRLVELYVDLLVKPTLQGSGDIKTRVRDRLGITNVQLPAREIGRLDDFFAARKSVLDRIDHVRAKREQAQMILASSKAE